MISDSLGLFAGLAATSAGVFVGAVTVKLVLILMRRGLSERSSDRSVLTQ